MGPKYVFYGNGGLIHVTRAAIRYIQATNLCCCGNQESLFPDVKPWNRG